MSNTNITNTPLIGKNSNGPVSLTTVSSPHSTFNESYFISNSAYKTNDIMINGQMVTVSFVMSFSEFEVQSGSFDLKSSIKKKLCHMMAEKMYKENLFSFTMSDNNQDDTKTFYARMFVTPNDQTQIIRQMLAKK